MSFFDLRLLITSLDISYRTLIINPSNTRVPHVGTAYHSEAPELIQIFDGVRVVSLYLLCLLTLVIVLFLSFFDHVFIFLY
jgi:hypothetical protein